MSDRYSQLVRMPVAGRSSQADRAARSRSSWSAGRPASVIAAACCSAAPGAAGRGRGAGAGRAAAPTRRPRSDDPVRALAAAAGLDAAVFNPARRRPTSASRRSCSTPPGSLDRRPGRAAARSSIRRSGACWRRGRVIVLGGRRGARCEGFTRSLGQGDRARRDGQPRARRARAPRTDRRDAAVPALAALGVRVRPGHPRRVAGQRRAARRARPRSSRAPRAGSARRSRDVLEREGASVVRLDLKDAELELDITDPDAPARLRRALRGGARHRRPQRGRDQGPHAGEDARGPLAVADGGEPARARADHGGAAAGAARRAARIVCVSSLSAIAGNAGQTNYATSKAGLIDLVDGRCELRARRSRSTPSRPGFIETAMTAAMPIGVREGGGGMNSLRQGGLPVDVAETSRGWRALGRREPQRRPGLRPEPAGGLTWGSTSAEGRALPGAGRRHCVPGDGCSMPDVELDERTRADGDRRRLRARVRLHAARRAAADLPARARVPAAHGALRRAPVQRRGRRAHRQPDRSSTARCCSARS